MSLSTRRVILSRYIYLPFAIPLDFLTFALGHPDPLTKELVDSVFSASLIPEFTARGDNEQLIRSYHPYLSASEAVAIWEHPEIRSFWLTSEPPELLGLKMPVRIGDKELLYWPGSQEHKPERKAPDDPLSQFRIKPEFPLPDFVQVKLKEMFPSRLKATLLTSPYGLIAISFQNTTDRNTALESQRPRTVGRLPLHFYVQKPPAPAPP